jgi:hypothetical protein
MQQQQCRARKALDSRTTQRDGDWMKDLSQEHVDKRLESLFRNLCLYLSFNPSGADEYRELHKFLLEWIKKYKGQIL